MIKKIFLFLLVLFVVFTLRQFSLAVEDSAYVNHRKGVDYASEGKFNDAQEWFEQNLETNKKDSTSASSLAVIKDLNDGKISKEYVVSFFKSLNLLQDGEFEKGVKELSKAIAIDPGYVKSYNVLGAAYASLGDAPKAENNFQKAIELDPLYVQAYYNLAVLNQSLGREEEALKDFKKVVELDSKSLDAVKNIASIYASIGQYDYAIKYYQDALKIDHENPDIYYNLSLVYFMSDQVMKFKLNLEKAQELYKQRGDAEGLKKVEEYMVKIRTLEDKMKSLK
ncbi:MAG: tetratricopeptide repeat protein [Candidatus Omnitrophota bacterium]